MAKLTITSLLGTILLAGCATAPSLPAATIGEGVLIRSDGSAAGKAELLQDGWRVFLRLAGTGFTSGTHAMHLHQQGKCDGPDFTSAGGHLNPYGRTHGKLSETGQHLGDLPNVDISQNGSFDVTTAIDGSTAALLGQIFDSDGTSVMLHAGADDYLTDPTGAAGARIACAVLVRAN